MRSNNMNMMSGQMQSQQMPVPVRTMSTPEQQKQPTLAMQQHTNYGVGDRASNELDEISSSNSTVVPSADTRDESPLLSVEKKCAIISFDYGKKKDDLLIGVRGPVTFEAKVKIACPWLKVVVYSR